MALNCGLNGSEVGQLVFGDIDPIVENVGVFGIIETKKRVLFVQKSAIFGENASTVKLIDLDFWSLWSNPFEFFG